jgi:fatty acid desaturase
MRTLCWNMPFHSEHHVCPQAPFFALPTLNTMVGAQLHPMGNNLWSVDRDVRRTCIVSRAEADRIITERKARHEQIDTSWLCALD